MFTAVRDDTGALIDLEYAAVSPEAVAPDGRRGAGLIGVRLSEFPVAADGDRWAVYQQVLDTGVPAELGPFEVGPSDVGPVTLTARLNRLGPSLLAGWTRDDQAGGLTERIAATEQLGNLGWGEWDLVSGEVHWSEQLYRIYERDPALGPLGPAAAEELEMSEDQPLRAAALDAFERHERVDLTTRVRIGGRVKHLRRWPTRSGTRPGTRCGSTASCRTSPPARRRPAGWPRWNGSWPSSVRSLAAEHEMAGRAAGDRSCRMPVGPIELPGLSRSRCATCRPSRRAWSAATGTTRRSCATGRCCWPSATWPGTAPAPRPRWPSCGTRCARSPSPPRLTPACCSATSTGSPAISSRRQPELAATAVVARFDPYDQAT